MFIDSVKKLASKYATALLLFVVCSASAFAQTTSFDVTVLLQGYWNGTTHTPTAVIVELRSGVDLETSTQSHVIDGLLSSTGEVSVGFEGVASGDYWLVIRHGNHLPVASASRITVTSGNTHTYDFSDASNKAYPGNGTSVVEYNVTGRYMLLSGDLDGDRAVGAIDFLNYMLPNFSQINPGGVPAIDQNRNE